MGFRDKYKTYFSADDLRGIINMDEEREEEVREVVESLDQEPEATEAQETQNTQETTTPDFTTTGNNAEVLPVDDLDYYQDETQEVEPENETSDFPKADFDVDVLGKVNVRTAGTKYVNIMLTLSIEELQVLLYSLSMQENVIKMFRSLAKGEQGKIDLTKVDDPEKIKEQLEALIDMYGIEERN